MHRPCYCLVYRALAAFFRDLGPALRRQFGGTRLATLETAEPAQFNCSGILSVRNRHIVNLTRGDVNHKLGKLVRVARTLPPGFLSHLVILAG